MKQIGAGRGKLYAALKDLRHRWADTQAVCDLKKNPNENKQYIIDVKT